MRLDMSKTRTPRELDVIKQIKQNYGDLFTFEKFVYKSLTTTAIFTCKHHGDIPITPASLIGKKPSKFGCKECYLDAKRETFDGWKEKAKVVHNNFYDYSYDGKEVFTQQKLVILHCPKHGDSRVNASSHLHRATKCRGCADELQYAKPVDEVVKKFQEKYAKYEYDYSLLTKDIYFKKDKITYICPKHGEKNTTVERHENSKCSECAVDDTRKDQDNWIGECNIVHNYKYKYPLVDYKNNITPVTIICDEHGPFTQYPNAHLSGHGCRECADELFFGGKNETQYFIPYLQHKLKYDITLQYRVKIDGSDKYFMIDAYIPERNIAIEYDEEYHKTRKDKDISRENYIVNKIGCEFVRISDKEFMENQSSILGVLREYDLC